jgi:glycosyltransferase involved in cell wall biosynthesis
MSVPIISVLMTAYNQEKYISEAIESVLASTFKDFELIIVDDCSKDNTVEIARKYEELDSRIKVYINEDNLGDYPNRNKAASYAIGKYLKYLDSDDVIYPHSLTVMVNAMEQFPEAGFGLSAIGDVKFPYPKMINMKTAYLEHFGTYGHFDRAPGSAIISKKKFDMVGGFSGKRMIGDNELWFTLARYYPLVKLPRDLVWDRIHDSQESQTEYAKSYESLRKAVVYEALSHIDCPLDISEINSVRKNLKRRQFKNIIKKWLGVVSKKILMI